MNEDIDIRKEAESLKTMIKRPVEISELEERISLYLNRYLMDIESSKRAIIKDYGGTDRDYIAPVEPDTPLSDLGIKRGSTINFTAKVSEIRGQMLRGDNLKFTVFVEDETSESKIIMWNKEPDFEEGKVYRFRGWKVVYDDFEKSIVLNDRGGSFEESDVKIESSAYSRNLKFSVNYDEIKEGMKNVTVSGAIYSIQNRRPGGSGPAVKGVFRFSDGNKMDFLLWNGELNAEPGDDVCITEVSVEHNSYTGRSQLKLSDSSKILRGE